MGYFLRFAMLVCLLLQAGPGAAQQSPMVFTTVERPPFSFTRHGEDVGFSIDLMREIAKTLGREVTFRRVELFSEMLSQVEAEAVDGAIANISITGAREAAMDFSQPIFQSGLQIMVPLDDADSGLWGAIFSWELALAILAAFAMLFFGGMLMWLFERRKQPYFDRPVGEALFPSFWWALNLVVNGGFEERMPRSLLGRIFGVLMVVSSLFIVSVFVAHITAALTIEAITGSINSVNDLEGRRVGTTTGSTASLFLGERDLAYREFDDLDTLLVAFEAAELDAVLFDGPLLAYYVATRGAAHGKMIELIFRPENYGIALPSGSAMREPINVALLRLRESGAYDDIYRRWFGGGRR